MQNNMRNTYLYIHGPEFEKFLQGQLTCDMKTLSTTPVLAAHCNPKGRIISLFWIYRYQGGVLLQMPADLVDIAIEHLNKYRVFFKATIEKIDAPRELPEALILTRAQKIEQKIPSIYAASSEIFLPHRINLTEFAGLSFHKGCYTGQEIIARMEFRGEIKHHLYRAIMAHVLEPGATLTHGAIIVDSIVHNNQAIALVTMKDEDAASFLQPSGYLKLTKESMI